MVPTISVILSQEIAVAFVEFDLELAVDPKCHTTSIPQNFFQQAKLQISMECLKSQWAPLLPNSVPYTASSIQQRNMKDFV